jgi:MoaA/NifB/PqqE/SkfB family radical SAM enzyme/cellulose synthase/poly-beta-1,6-N-acetylglucosamine synthase-like glycosyltransferase
MSLGDARWIRRAVHPGGLPVQLTFFVTSRCNAKCAHCFYGDQLNQPAERELTLEEIERVARGLPRMLWVAFGGGEPFLRRDLAEVAGVFCRWNRPRILTVVTNGIHADHIESVTRDILAKRRDTFINISVSLDGLAETHDRERGVPGNFRQAVETLHKLRALRERHDGFGFSTITTVHGRNADEMADLERYIAEEIRPDNRGLNLVRGTPLDPATLDVNLQAYGEAVERKRRDVSGGTLPLQNFSLSTLNAAKERVMYRDVERVARTGAYRAPCRAGRIGAVMYENGDVAACEILDRKIGNVRDVGLDFSRLWFSPAADTLRREIDEGRCRCTWECAVATNVLFGPRYWPELLREWVTGGRRSSVAAPRAPLPQSVTVLIPCRDEATVIRRKIRNSLNLRFPNASQSEVLVIDDGSTDRSVELIEAEIARSALAVDRPRLRWLRNRYAQGKAGAIQTGLEAARGDVVLLTDADVVIEREALPRAIALFADPRTGVVTGRQAYCERLPDDSEEAPGDPWNRRGGAVMDPPGRVDSLYDRLMRRVRSLESRLDSVLLVHGQMVLFRRSLTLEPRAGIASDDVDLSLQARRQGYRIRYAEEARFWEERPRTRSARTQQGKRHGMSIAQVLWANRDMVGRPRYGLFGMLDLPFQWALLLAQPIGLFLMLTLGTAAVIALAPLPWTLAVAALALLAAASKGVRSYLVMNGLMASAIVSMLAGRQLTDRWPRDRDIAPLEL